MKQVDKKHYVKGAGGLGPIQADTYPAVWKSWDFNV
jgi:hypothetical protein